MFILLSILHVNIYSHSIPHHYIHKKVQIVGTWHNNTCSNSVIKFHPMCHSILLSRASGNGLTGSADPVLAGWVFLKVKMNFHFYKKQIINKSTSVIFELFGLLYYAVIDRISISRSTMLSATHTLCLQCIQLCKKLSNKQSGSVIFRPIRLITW